MSEIKANHAATVMQKLHRDASKVEMRQKLQGFLYKRSGSLPFFQNMAMMIQGICSAFEYEAFPGESVLVDEGKVACSNCAKGKYMPTHRTDRTTCSTCWLNSK